MTEQEKQELIIIVSKTIVTFGVKLIAVWIIYYLYYLLWK